ncbi:glycosyl hydrolase family 2, sugar binding domain protein [Bacteroides ovatus ATCC 8483]|uniref:Beta-mannosidase B n=4 Tax=Bacteroides TaxID=816 RepID=A0AAN3AC93_BACO1|nr:glycosyl hydrolase family 2, sugar binding domain protein [Bacteroides ovatus ATCC 8483]
MKFAEKIISLNPLISNAPTMMINLIGKKAQIACELLCCCSMAYAQSNDNSEVVVLNTGWEFSQAGTELWRPAQVPGTVHQDLINHKQLPDPFYGINEQKIQWVENEDWEYRTAFTVTPEQLKRDDAQLVFEGLDTYADVYLNGALLLKADNMFVGYTIPVKSQLRIGENLLHIYFHSPIRQTLPQYNSNGFNYPADNDHHDKHLSIFSRKAPYSYGWDWGIRMVTSGIWRPVTIRFYDAASISDYHVKQLALTDQLANLSNELEINNILSRPLQAEVRINTSFEGSAEKSISQAITLQPGINHVSIPSEVASPVRWMPNGWGKPALYDFSAQIIVEDKVVAEQSHRIGLRTVRLVNEKDKDGESFYFEVNGVPMFAKGANYIPQDALLTNVTTERYQTLFRDIREANMNVIRVWGGGTYEDDRFYDLADENGILVWQDFMFACTPYPFDPTFLKRVEAEACYNIRRLRNHASLAMWCGNNEILEALKYWGFDKNFPPEIYQEMFRGYDKLFHQLLPAKVKELDADRFYIHSSPYFANWGRPESWGIGDSHNWGVWYGQKTFESLDTDLPRFMSEFGFQSFPEMKTISTFAAPEDYQIESEVMNAHQKSSIGNALIRTYMERDYIIPEKFEDFVYVGLVLQGQGMRHGLEAHRRNRPYCMGTLYWQLNDSWPVVSWSSIDYYGNWKALHYQAKRVFAPILINPIRQNDSLNIYLISDCPDTKDHLMLEMKVTDFDGKKQGKPIQLNTLTVPANTSQCVYRIKPDTWLSPEEQQRCFMQLTLKDKAGNTLAETVYFFRKTKDLLLPETTVSCKMKQKDGMCELTLFSPALAKDVFIEIPLQGARFSDNFFDLLPGERKTVVITSPQIKKGEELPLTIKHIRETYN